MKNLVIATEIYQSENNLPSVQPCPDSDYKVPFLVLGAAESAKDALPLLEARDRQLKAMGYGLGYTDHPPHIDDVHLVKAADAERHVNRLWASLCAHLGVPAIWVEVKGDIFLPL